MFRDQRVFLQQFFRQYHTTGSVWPSSRALAKALCRFVDDAGSRLPERAAINPSTQPSPARGEGDSREILEVGPGTGAVTAQLVKKLRPEDKLTLVELNDDFVRHMRRRFETEPAFQAVADRAQIVHARLEDLPEGQRFNVIISGLPLNNFEVPQVEQIVGIFQRLLGPGGTLSFFEYIAIRRVKALVSGPPGRARLQGIGQVLERTLMGREIKRDWVWPNMPPAWVHHVRFAEERRGENMAEKSALPA
ncbi:MAG TPA: methyltransferase domain-containing protein [Pirellulales bacterium]|jgi:phospholipid N-methyltransferase|nr:methyltransferase domain-containing protein [Pirellulales bacterium]